MDTLSKLKTIGQVIILTIVLIFALLFIVLQIFSIKNDLKSVTGTRRIELKSP